MPAETGLLVKNKIIVHLLIHQKIHLWKPFEMLALDHTPRGPTDSITALEAFYNVLLTLTIIIVKYNYRYNITLTSTCRSSDRPHRNIAACCVRKPR